MGHEISNGASIYFDNNFPIHTNIAQTQVIEDIISSNTNFDQYNDLEFYPSISSGLIYLNDHELKGNIVVLNINGGIVLKSKVSQDASIDISSLDAGTYIIQMIHSEKLYIGKVIKI